MKPALGEHWRRQPHSRLTLICAEDVQKGGGRRRDSRVRLVQLSSSTLGVRSGKLMPLEIILLIPHVKSTCMHASPTRLLPPFLTQ